MMKFDDLDAHMRIFETAHDHAVLPDIHMVARLDGRGFTKLTREGGYNFQAPFDERFRDTMVATVEHLMTCGLRVTYGYTQSDEISLLLHRDENLFGRKLRKLNSVLAGEASAKFSLVLGGMGTFDCRISQLPNVDRVCDYFRWRSGDAHRNALNAHCYWQLRGEGLSARRATATLAGMSVANKNELLFQRGINFNDLPNWQKRGIGFYWETYEKLGRDPRTGEAVPATRRRIRADLELPLGDAYGKFIHGLIGGDGDA